MRTILVFHAASDTGEALWYCEMDDFAGKPHRGDLFVNDHKVFEVAKTHVCLGVRDGQGHLRSGNEKLLELLNTLYGNQKALGLYARLLNIGSGDAPDVSTGGIIMPRASLAGEFDNIVLCEVKLVRSAATATAFGDLLKAAHKLHSSKGLPAIKLDDGATSKTKDRTKRRVTRSANTKRQGR